MDTYGTMNRYGGYGSFGGYGAYGYGYGGMGGTGYGGGPGDRTFGQIDRWGGTDYATSEQLDTMPDHTGRGPRSYQRSDDRIEEDVNQALTDHPGVDATDIEVKVKHGEVTLTGTVENRRAKRMAEDAADSVRGVRDVHNRLRLRDHVPAERGQKGE